MFRLAGNETNIRSYSDDELKSVSKNVTFKLHYFICTLLLK